MAVNISIFASGNGSNAQRICEHFKDSHDVKISLILTNKKEAFVIQRAKILNIPCLILEKSDFDQSELILKILKTYNIHWIILAGFLLKIPKYLIDAFPKRIINIHPALLPKFGGKGMYGENVHKAVIAAGERQSGITVHYVNELYDEGEVIFQAKVSIEPEDSVETLAQKIHVLEYEHFPVVISKVINSVL